jgi:hypothetical protein
MIRGMICRETKVSTAISFIVLFTGFGGEPGPLLARPKSEFSLAHQSTPKLEVRVHSFSGVSAWTLEAAETEAARILRPISIQLRWIDCTARVLPAACLSPQLPTDLIVRILPKALPEVSTAALGITDSSDRYAAAFVFYDRIVALRTHTSLLSVILGRVIAHEISHLLVPQEGHSELGLMRGQWAADDLRIASSLCLGLPAKSVQLMQQEALRRVLGARSER